MKTKQILIAAAFAAMLPTMSVQANVVGMADLTITSFALINQSTGAPVTTGLNVTSDSRTGTAASDFNGVAGVGSGLGSITLGGGANVDVKYRCAGPDCGSISGLYGGNLENNQTTHITGPATANYALGDMFISGSALNGGSNGMTRANASATGPTNIAGAQSTIQNSARVITTFSAQDNFSGALALTADAFVRAFVGAGSVGGADTFASGSIAWSVSVLDITGGGNVSVLTWTPSQLNAGRFASDPADSDSYSFVGSLLSPFVDILSGHTYTMVITQSSLATVSEVPEPETLALVGLALFGLAATQRARRRN